MFTGPTIRIRIPFTLITLIVGALMGYKYGELSYHERKELREKAAETLQEYVAQPVQNHGTDLFWWIRNRLSDLFAIALTPYHLIRRLIINLSD